VICGSGHPSPGFEFILSRFAPFTCSLDSSIPAAPSLPLSLAVDQVAAVRPATRTLEMYLEISLKRCALARRFADSYVKYSGDYWLCVRIIRFPAKIADLLLEFFTTGPTYRDVRSGRRLDAVISQRRMSSAPRCCMPRAEKRHESANSASSLLSEISSGWNGARENYSTARRRVTKRGSEIALIVIARRTPRTARRGNPTRSRRELAPLCSKQAANDSLLDMDWRAPVARNRA